MKQAIVSGYSNYFFGYETSRIDSFFAAANFATVEFDGLCEWNKCVVIYAIYLCFGENSLPFGRINT